jgi:hypothetical protein
MRCDIVFSADWAESSSRRLSLLAFARFASLRCSRASLFEPPAAAAAVRLLSTFKSSRLSHARSPRASLPFSPAMDTIKQTAQSPTRAARENERAAEGGRGLTLCCPVCCSGIAVSESVKVGPRWPIVCARLLCLAVAHFSRSLAAVAAGLLARRLTRS